MCLLSKAVVCIVGLGNTPTSPLSLTLVVVVVVVAGVVVVAVIVVIVVVAVLKRQSRFVNTGKFNKIILNYFWLSNAMYCIAYH